MCAKVISDFQWTLRLWFAVLLESLTLYSTIHVGSSDVTEAVVFTSVHKEQYHLGGAESFGSSLSHRAGKTSCHSGSRCLGAITDQPHGCPK